MLPFHVNEFSVNKVYDRRQNADVHADLTVTTNS